MTLLATTQQKTSTRFLGQLEQRVYLRRTPKAVRSELSLRVSVALEKSTACYVLVSNFHPNFQNAIVQCTVLLYVQENKNSLSTGDPENSGFSRMQLIHVSHRHDSPGGWTLLQEIL